MGKKAVLDFKGGFRTLREGEIVLNGPKSLLNGYLPVHCRFLPQ